MTLPPLDSLPSLSIMFITCFSLGVFTVFRSSIEWRYSIESQSPGAKSERNLMSRIDDILRPTRSYLVLLRIYLRLAVGDLKPASVSGCEGAQGTGMMSPLDNWVQK